ncbi:MAG: ABC transporter substrate-binding protein [Roseburia sp.]
MKKQVVSILLVLSMAASLLAGCGDSGSSKGSVEGGTETAEGESGEYTYHTTTSMVSTWSPTDWQIASEYDILGYAMSSFWAFRLNEAMDDYVIEPDLATDYPEDVTAEYAGNETYGVPADATEGYAWKVTLREDATWEDGTPIDAGDVEYSLQQFLNPEMKNYRASLFYTGSVGIANAKSYYESGAILYGSAVDSGLSIGDLTVDSEGNYTDAEGNPAYFAWSATMESLGYALTDYADYFPEETYSALDALANGDGYIPMTEESKELLFGFTSSDTWGNETEEDLIYYVAVQDGVGESVDWSNVGFVKDDDYTFTVILTNPTTLFNVESGLDSLTLIKEDLYEANKQETGGVIKSSYGTAVDKFSSYGPYKVVDYQEGKQITLAKNENWYGYSDPMYEGKYQTTGIVLQMIDEHSTQLSLFLQGKLDVVGLAADDMDTYGTSDYIYFTPETYTYYLTLNTDFDLLKSRETEGVNKTIFTYEDFRHALSVAVDRNDYVKSCTAGYDPAYGLLNDIYICDPETNTIYRDTDYAQQTLCDVYGVSDVSELTGYDKEEASVLLQSAYDACYADGNISDDDVVEIEYHVYGTDSHYQKTVDFVQNALDEAAVGTSLDGRIKVTLVEDQDYYNSMKTGQDDMILGAWGGADTDPYSMMQCYCDPDYITEYGFDPYQELTISVQGEDVTNTFNGWYLELCEGEYATAELDVRNEVLAGIEEGLLSDYHIIPMISRTSATLYSQRIVWPCDWVNSIVQRGGLENMTYTMDDAEWDAYCAEQGNNLTY